MATPHNIAIGLPRPFARERRYFLLKYTKYFCEKVPGSHRKIPLGILSPNYAVLPYFFLLFCGERRFLMRRAMAMPPKTAAA